MSELFHGRKHQILIVGICLVILVSWLNVLDRKTEGYVNDATVQALATYATLRLANAAVSVAESVEVDAQVASVQVGAALDPVDTLIEEGSNVLRFAIGSLITQKIIVEIVSTPFFKIMLTLAGLLLILSLCFRSSRYADVLLKTFSLAVLTRFLLVMVVFLNAIFDQAFIDRKTEGTRQELERNAAEMSQAVGDPESSLDAAEADEVKERIEQNDQKREALLARIEAARREAADAESALDKAEADLSALEADKGIVERYFPESAEHKALVERVKANRAAHGRAIDRLDALATELDLLDAEKADLVARLNGEDQGYWRAAMEKIGSVKKMTDIGAWQENAEAMIDSILRIMALFVLKTVIMPVVFLALLLKGFRYLWGIDARTFLAKQWKEARE